MSLGHTFVWYDALARDVDAAQAFYQRVFGWAARDSETVDYRYILFSLAERPLAGLFDSPEDKAIPPCWTGYIAVDDVERAAARIQAAGGTVLEAARTIEHVGRFAVVADPLGAVFIVYHSFRPAESVGDVTQGAVGWHELHASDPERAWTFYSEQFGWRLGPSYECGGSGKYLTFICAGEHEQGGVARLADGQPVSYWLYYFNVADIDATLARIAEAGGKVLFGPVATPDGGQIAHALDPEGAMFGVVRR